MLATDFIYDEECAALLAPASRNLHAIFAPFPVTYQFSQTTVFTTPDRYRRTVPVIGFLANILPLEDDDETEAEFDEAPYARLVEESDHDEWHFEWPTTMPSVPRNLASVATQSNVAVSASTGTQVVGVAVATTATQSSSTSTTSVSVGSTMNMTTSTGVQVASIVPVTPTPIPRITISTLVGTDDMAADLQRARLVEVADALVDAVLREVAREVPAAAAEMMALVEAEMDDDVATCVGDDGLVMEAAAVATVSTAVARPASPCPSVSSDESGEYEWVDAAEAVE
ncbi:hypothetical protein AMAG_03089 [Allomyces macrogynus ATCC 38327]|uniref:Uncharacterized protein n=1 Tax=Allomyces macrogynus (strain ATCC 38327) TaxID=578462 RepID=A0A0L0S496_ALLM3|nr:hypothetical protein AMAG_03089 [Allomyces macrogynus ATCC 38327]|eukprot:KNE57368.1 hypothetical protein AMAG_03089 [Allomyces macrogynus ATCC 38327]